MTIPRSGERAQRRFSRAASLVVALLFVLAACGRGTTGDLSATDSAVEAASNRVVSVTSSKWQVNGLSHGITMEIRLNNATPISDEDLDSIVKAIWLTAPGEPNSIDLMAFADEAQKEPVDLRGAAEKLTPMASDGFGRDGVSLIRMWKRYGKWRNPT